MRFVFTVIFIIIFFPAFTQNGVLKGVVVDFENNKNIPFATISIFNKGYINLLNTTISDAGGRFEIEDLPFSEMQIVILVNGYVPDTLNLFLSKEKSPLDLGEIKLKPALIIREDIEAYGLIPAFRKIDRQTYFPDDFETARGGTATDLLNKLPSVSVAPDGTVLLRGTSEFKIYLNEKPTQIENSVLIGQISANSIESIDVIFVPTANYVAQGRSGIINISTKKRDEEGLSVSVNGLIGGAPWGNETDKLSNYKLNDNRYSGGVDFSYSKNKLSLFGGLNYNKQNVNVSRTGDTRLLQENGSYFHVTGGGNRPEWNENYSANAGFNYNLGGLNALSGSYFYGHRNEGRSMFYVYNTFFADINKKPLEGINPLNQWLYNSNFDKKSGIFHRGNLEYSLLFPNNSKLRLSALFEHSELNRRVENKEFDFSQSADEVGILKHHLTESENIPLNGYRFSADYAKELDNGDVVSVGFEPQLINHSGDFNYDTLNTTTGNWGTNVPVSNYIDFSQAVYAGFVNYTGGWGQFRYIAGLRLEFTDQKLETQHPEYLNIFNHPSKTLFEINRLDVFPVLHAKYDLNENNTFIFAAGRRINRPAVRYMAPFLYRRHLEVFEMGNPDLKPEYISHIELSVNKKVGPQSFTLTGFIRGTNDAVFRVNAVYPEENVLIRSYSNIGASHAAGGEINASFVAGPKLNFFVGGALYNFKIEGDVFGYRESTQSTNWNFKGNMDMMLTDALKFTFDVDLRSASVTLQGSSEFLYRSDVAFNYSPEILGNLNLGLKVLDIFNSSAERINTRIYNPSAMEIFHQDVEYNRFGPVLELNATWNFSR